MLPKKEAYRILADRTSLYDLSGKRNSGLRQEILTAITDAPKRIPKARAGINALLAAALKISGVKGGCWAAREEALQEWCRKQSR